MKIRTLMAAAALSAAALTLGSTGAFAAPAGGARPRVEVAFVLDATGSMGGLIEGAKQKIWSIANSIISGKPTPVVKIGLMGFRDRGDEFVTRTLDLTDDIDAVFKALSALRADGGGDEPESVNQALSETVRRMSWSPGGDVLKIVFLVGDSPPHIDYADDVKYPETCREAARRGIIINTVQCGDNPATTPFWNEIARLSEGAYVALAQTGNMQTVATPYDEEIARIGADLGATVVAYGRAEVQEQAREKAATAAAAPAPVAADRAAYNLASGGKAILGSGDLVADSAEGKVDLSRLKADELPAEMRKMSGPERAAYVAKRQAERDALNTRLARLVAERASYLDKELRRTSPSGRHDSFDAAVSAMIADEAARIR